MKSPKTVLLFVVGCVLLTACGGGPPAAAPTAPPQATQAPQATAAPAPTATMPPAPTPVPTVDPNKVIPGGKVIFGTPQEPNVLNPLLSSSSIEDAVSSLTVEGLVEVNAEGQYEAVLADSLPTLSDDGLVVTYTIRPGLKFSNGDPLTCADVKFTLEAILSDLSQASTSGYSDIDSLECKDDHTVVVTFAQVYAPYLRLFSYILPKSAGDLAKLDSWEYNRNPVGTGPWIVKEWQAGDHITFAKNPNYREAGKPYLDSLIIKILPSREVGMQLLGTGEIDALWDLTEADFPALKQLGDKVTYAGAYYGSGENELLLFNLADPAVDAPSDPAKHPHPILADLKVRQAIQMGIDKKLLADTLLYGNVRIGTTVLPAGPFACPQEASRYDVEGAKKLLEEAGWKPGADGIRVKDGKRLSLKITSTSGNKLREDTEQVLVEMMKEIGIELKIENVPSDVLFAGWDANGMRKHGKFDILMYTTGPAIDPDSHLFSNYHSARIPTADNKGNGSNYSRYINADVDKWIDDASATTDMAKRKALYCQVAAQINKDLPRVYLYERLLISGYRTRLKNFIVSSGSDDFAVNAANWWVSP